MGKQVPQGGDFRRLVRNLRKGDAKEKILYQMARLLRNTDELNAPTWGGRAGNLLIDLRELDPETYDREVKGPKTPEAP